MATEAVSANASIASTGLGLRYVGKNWVYATSGVRAMGGAEEAALEGTTGTGIIVGTVQFFTDQTAGDNYRFKMYYNNVVVLQAMLAATHESPPYGYYPIDIVIPPITEIKVTLENVSAGTDRNWTILLGGRVYGVE